ncbi:MAG TPA: carbohydrate kinase family protein [Candidatus Xenobia bacterium]|jgi:pseudouridine kinase
MRQPTVVVVGGANLDIKGKPHVTLVAHTSNPGQIDLTAGGVGRNIAENLARLGVRTRLITVFGEDAFGRTLAEKTAEPGVDVSPSLFLPDAITSLFVAVMTHRGDLETAIADMGILDRMTPEFLETRRAVLEEADFVVMDADVPLPCIEYVLDICEARKTPVCIEPVSVAKAQRIAHLLGRLSMVTPNREEAEVLVQLPLNDVKGIEMAGQEIMTRGVRWVMITLGPEGVFLASEKQQRFVSSIATIVSDSVGAGDALTAGTVCGLVYDKPYFESVRMGVAAATMTLMTPEAVSRSLTWESLHEVLERVPKD